MNTITKIINLWDPIGLFPMAPLDEYEVECQCIYTLVQEKQDITVQELGDAISLIFKNRFGIDVYQSKIQECYIVSGKILKDLHK